MKLFQKYNRLNLLVTIAVFILSGIAFFFLVRYIIFDQLDDDLEIEQKEIIIYTEKNHHLPEVVQLHDQQIFFIKTDKYLSRNKPVYQTIKLHNKKDKEPKLYRELLFNIQANNELWLVSVRKSLEDTDELLQSILMITLSCILLILVITFIINRMVIKKLWQPFYISLKTIENFRVNEQKKLMFDTTGIDEFDVLNSTLKNSVNKAQHDYQVLKEFTENASHELQTPLAIINSKLDNLIQDKDLTERQSDIVIQTYEAVKRLSKLNQSLLLLAKIENKQFEEVQLINLKESLETKLLQLQDLFLNRQLQLTSILHDATIFINPMLTDILIQNLLSNSIKHNIHGGAVSVELFHNKLTITNTGLATELNNQDLFNRFYKGSTSADGNGLGLSIIKQICDVSNYNIHYTFKHPNLHSFVISW